MYHLGKIEAVYSSNDKNIMSEDSSTQALVEMWDSPKVIFRVADPLAGKVKKDDFVLVDYTPRGTGQLAPRQIIVKILGKKLGAESWKSAKSWLEERKNKGSPAGAQAPIQIPAPVPQFERMTR